jgi:predicted nucleic acid-binding protein
MARYLLDTNILSYLLDTASPFHAAAHGRLARLADEDEVVLSILSLYELHHWFAYHPAPRADAHEIICDFRIVPLSETGAELFGALMRDLRAGRPRAEVQRHAIDCIIAVTALEGGAVLVSNDALFAQLVELVPALELDNWAAIG